MAISLGLLRDCINAYYKEEISLSKFLEVINGKSDLPKTKTMNTEKWVLQTQKQMLKDSIVEIASRLVKDTEDSVKKGGMIEVGARWVEMLDGKLFELDQLERQINQES